MFSEALQIIISGLTTGEVSYKVKAAIFPSKMSISRSGHSNSHIRPSGTPLVIPTPFDGWHQKVSALSAIIRL
jgi:hypothetical protein